MASVFEVASILGKKIRLTETQVEHIQDRHPEFKGQTDKIKRCIEQPDLVLYDLAEDNYQYCKYFVETPVGQKHLVVIVRYLNGDGFVITSLFVSSGKLRLVNKECVYGQVKDFH